MLTRFIGTTSSIIFMFLFSGQGIQGQSHPSGVLQRVLIAVQNPTGMQGGSPVLAPQFSLQIANAATDSFPTSAPPTISGYGLHIPASLENLTGQGYGVVQNEDGSALMLNYGSEAVSGSNIGSASPVNGSVLTENLRYMITASELGGAITVQDLQSSNPPVKLNLAGASSASVIPGSSVALVFAADANVVYYLRHLSATHEQGYANGQWPPNAVDCEPYSLPTFCLMQLAPAGANVATFSQTYFDHPIKAVISSTGESLFVLNGGAEADGVKGSVTVVPAGPVALEDGTQSGTIPNSLTQYQLAFPAGTVYGVDNAIAAGTKLYVAGQARVSPGVWKGQLSVIDVTTGTASNPMNIADGIPVRMTLADDNTLWIGSIRCNTGENAQAGTPFGCLTVVNLTSASVGLIEDWYCVIDSSTKCSGDHPDSYRYQGGGSGDVTGIAPITGLHKVYYVEHGQVHIRQTISPYSIVPNNGVTVAGVAVDVTYMDAGTDNDGTATSTQR